MSALLTVEKLTQRFGQLTALRSVDMSIHKGEILGMIGPNGSGKTTLFNIASGMSAPVSGEVRFQGRLITRWKPHVICRMGLARTFQVMQPFSRLTVLDNVLIGAMHGQGLRAGAALETANEVLRFTGLDAMARKTPNEMTAAARRRLELARALATGPQLILLDETMAGLTPTEIDSFLVLLRDIQARGITIFMVEHIMRAVMTICTRIIVLSQGEKIAEGTPQEVAANGEVIQAYLGGVCA